MGRHLLAIPVLLVALIGCSIRPPTPAPSSSGPPALAPTAFAGPTAPPSPSIAAAQTTSPPPGQLLWFEQARLSDGDRLLTLEFTGGPQFRADDPCSRAYAGWTEQVGDVLKAAVVDVTATVAPTAGETPIACDAVGHPRSVAVRLTAPFGGSRLEDLAGYVHFLRPPRGLAELHALPAGWLLRSQGDVQESPTGRWLRTYAPMPDPPLGTSKGKIDLYQAFDGPVNVTGGEEHRTVTVNGRPASLDRSAPDGELVLVWSLGPDGLALVANETDLSVDDLIALAESATPGS